MALKKSDRTNFNTLRRAAVNGHLALVECADRMTGAYRAVVCAVTRDGETVEMTPIAILPWENPFDMLVDPVEAQQRDAVNVEPACMTDETIEKMKDA